MAAPPSAEPAQTARDRLWLIAQLEMLLHKVCIAHRQTHEDNRCRCQVCREGVSLIPQIVQHKGFLIGMRLPVAYTPKNTELLVAVQVLAEHAEPLGG